MVTSNCRRALEHGAKVSQRPSERSDFAIRFWYRGFRVTSVDGMWALTRVEMRNMWLALASTAENFFAYVSRVMRAVPERITKARTYLPRGYEAMSCQAILPRSKRIESYVDILESRTRSLRLRMLANAHSVSRWRHQGGGGIMSFPARGRRTDRSIDHRYPHRYASVDISSSILSIELIEFSCGALQTSLPLLELAPWRVSSCAKCVFIFNDKYTYQIQIVAWN